MADKPHSFPMPLPVSQSGNQTATRPPRAPSSSSPPAYFFPPTPTKVMQDAFALPQDRRSSMASKHPKPCDISNLMSPPEPTPLDMFKSGGSASGKPISGPEQRVPHQPLSPPVSPFSQATNAISPAPTLNLGGKDPILYPASEASTGAPTGPLFSPTQASVDNFRADTERLVDEHIASRPVGLFRDTTPPSREHYVLALRFQSTCVTQCRENPAKWLRRERELLRADRKHTAFPAQTTRLPPILPAARPVVLGPQAPKSVPASRIQKARPPKAKPQNPRPIRATPAPAREAIRVGTPEPRVRTVAPNREDKDFASLEDLCPPVNTLPAKANSLKVDWKGNALDLSNDPNRNLLHPDELILASNLRLDCATYLTSKRRIFLRRLECARIGKEFRKTDAQQACKIDVNKASKLWQAYERVGWLHIDWMGKYLGRKA